SGTHGDCRRRLSVGLDDVYRRDALGVSIGWRQTSFDHQSVAVLHQGMPHEAELGLFARALAIEPRLWIGSRGVGVVRALLAVKIRLPVPPVSVRGRFVRAILRPEALH